MNARWTPRWWHWLLFSTVVIALMLWAVLFTLRMSGRAEYQRVVADLRAKGKAATIDEFIARAPSVDVTLQEEWYRWSQTSVDYPWNVPTFKPDQWAAFVQGDAPLQTDLLAEFETKRPMMAPARRMLQDPRLLISAFGWLAQDLPPGKRSLPHSAALRMPNLLSLRALANWLHHAACIEPDPRPALADLDQLHRALSRPATLIDAMIWIAVDSIRNETYLDLALMGRLPASQRDAWLAESCHLLGGVADAFEGERTCFVDAWARMGDEMSLLTAFTTGRVITMETGFGGGPTPFQQWLSLEWLYSGPWNWATIHHDSAISAEYEAQITSRLRGELSGPLNDPMVIQARYRGYGAMAVTNLLESVLTALEADANHRLIRLAVSLLARAEQGLPTDQTELNAQPGAAMWLTPPGDHLHLAYERLALERFRLTVSPTSPTPDFDEATRLPGRSKSFGTPAGTRLLIKDRTCLELQVPARLRAKP